MIRITIETDGNPYAALRTAQSLARARIIPATEEEKLNGNYYVEQCENTDCRKLFVVDPEFPKLLCPECG